MGYRTPVEQNGSSNVSDYPSLEVKGMSKQCKEYSVDLSACFDGELEGEALLKLEAHLPSCIACRSDLQKLQRIRNALTSLASTPPGKRPILEALREKLEKETEEDPQEGPLVC